MGDIACGCRFQAKMHKMWASDNAVQKKCGKKHKGFKKKLETLKKI
jgi:hypothetical protein